MEPLKLDLVCYEKINKTFKEQSKSVRAIKYNPDFIGHGWVMETKGMKTADFQLKWKLFKRYLLDHELDYLLLLPSNLREVRKSIELIKELNNGIIS